jgi:hypothetical protein
MLGPITSTDSFGIVGRDHLNHGCHTNQPHRPNMFPDPDLIKPSVDECDLGINTRHVWWPVASFHHNWRGSVKRCATKTNTHIHKHNLYKQIFNQFIPGTLLFPYISANQPDQGAPHLMYLISLPIVLVVLFVVVLVVLCMKRRKTKRDSAQLRCVAMEVSRMYVF